MARSAPSAPPRGGSSQGRRGSRGHRQTQPSPRQGTQPAPRQVTQPAPQGEGTSRRGPNVIWTLEMDEYMVNALVDDITTRPRHGNNGFRTQSIKAAVEAVNVGASLNINGEDVRSRWKTMRKLHIIAKQALESSGFGCDWDENRMYLTADPGAWDEYILHNPDAKLVRNKSFPLYDKVQVLVGEDTATGEVNVTGTDEAAINPTPHDSTTIDDNDDYVDLEEPNDPIEGEGVELEDDSPVTRETTAGSRKGPAPKTRKRVDVFVEPESLKSIAASIKQLAESSSANAIVAPKVEDVIQAISEVPNITPDMEMKAIVLLGDKPLLAKVFMALEERLKMGWLLAQFMRQRQEEVY